PRRGLETPALAPVRPRDAQAPGRAAEAGGLQDGRRLGPPDPQLCAGQQPHQGPAHQRRNLGHAEGAGRRPGCLHRGVAQAGRVTMQAEALIFDMDGTMIDSMPWHAKSWVEFARRHGITMPADEILRRTTGRTGTECMREVFERELADDECLALVHEKEVIYRELFDATFTEVAGFTDF